MNSTLPAAIGGTLRHFLTLGAGYVVGKGLIPEEMGPELIAGGMALAVLIWSWYQKQVASRKLSAAIAAPAGLAAPAADPDPGYRGGRFNAHPLAVAAAIGLVLLLAGCAGGVAPLIDLDTPIAATPSGDTGGAAVEPGTSDPAIETVGDMLKICVDRGTVQNVRSACVALGFAGVVELMTDRVTRFDPQDAAVSLGRIATLQAIQMRFDKAGGIFFNTEIRLATLTVTEMLADVARDRIGRDIGLFAGGINVPGLLRRGEVVARQAAIAAAVAADVKSALTQMLSGTLDPGEVRLVALARIEQNEARIAGVAGAIP